MKDKSKQVDFILKVILVFNLLVVLIKVYIGTVAQSLSILGDAVHSGVDSINNIIGIWAIAVAAKPPDKDHQYGHAKFETLGALAVVLFLAVASFELIEKSITRFMQPQELPIIDWLVITMLSVTLIINIFVWAYEKRMGKKLDSQLLLADAEHTWSDILITLSILLSTYFIMQGYYILDPILGIVIAFIIAKSAWKILNRTVPILVDEAWIGRADLEELVLSVDKVSELVDIKSRKGQDIPYIEMAIRFDTDSLSEAHELSHDIENMIIERFGQAKVTIHIEPV